MSHTRESISRILAVGAPSSDGVHRLTRGNSFVCCEGEGEEHEQLAAFCQDLEALLEASGLDLRDFTPEEFSEWVLAFQEELHKT